MKHNKSVFYSTWIVHSNKQSVCNCLYWCRFTSTRGGKPIGTANCLSPRSCKTVRGGRAVSPARGWSCSPCCASKPVTTWPSSSTATQIPPGSSSTAWPTVTVGVTAFRCCACYDIKLILEMRSGICTGNCFCNTGGRISPCPVTQMVLKGLRNPVKKTLI